MRHRFRTLIGFALLGLTTLAGCTGPTPPTYGDAFKSVYNGNASAVPVDAPVTVGHPVGIVLSDNVELWIEYVKAANAYWGARVPTALTNTVLLADTDPNFLSARVLDMLKRHFPEAQVVKDFNAAVAANKRAVVLVDVVPQPLQPYGDRTTKFDITYYFFDSAMNPVSKITGHGEQYRPIGALDGGVQYSVDAALAQLDQKMAAVVH
ncbi:MAG TPA: hypothetical protein VG328_03710 [Stellaceae bacterium]|jgi:hypothetical protein|nr:hypothetical protein [Stellaceae bacterium]